MESTAVTPLPQKLMQTALSCPRCEAPATPLKRLQTCVHCKKPFLLVSGARHDAAIVPPSKSGAPGVKLKYAGAVLRHMALVDDDGITDAELDPVTGHIPVSKRVTPFSEIVTIGIYRRIDWLPLVLITLLYLPVVALLLLASIKVLLIFTLSLPALALLLLGYRTTIGVGYQRMRIVSSTGPVSLRFDTPMWKRKRFLTQVLTRSGVGDIPWQ